MPWALQTALRCLDMRTGQWIHLPRDGGMWDQDKTILLCIEHAWRTWYVYTADADKLTKRDQRYKKTVSDGCNK